MNEDENPLGGRLPLLGKSELTGAQSTLDAAMDEEMLPWERITIASL